MQTPIKKYILFPCLALPLSCMAGTMGANTPSKNWSIPIQGGFFVAKQGRAQNIAVTDMDGSRYTLDNNSQINILSGIGLYWNGYSNERVQLSYGVDVFYLAETQVRGSIVQEQFVTNFKYKYDLQNVPLYAAVKALINTNNPAYNVTVDLGVGPNFMWLNKYHETPLFDGVSPDRAFTSNSATTFTVTAGVGVRLNNILDNILGSLPLKNKMPAFMNNMPVECGYRFFYLGETNLKRNNDQYLDSLDTGNTYANALVCSAII